MALFKKKISPQDLGKVLYTNIRYGIMSSESPFNHNKLINDLNEDPDNLKWSYFIEILIFAMYLSFETLMKKYPSSTGLEVMKGIHSEFMAHIQPILKPDLNMGTVEQIIQMIDNRFSEYGECLRNQKGAGPAWHLGVKAYWNIIGYEKEDPGPPLLLSMYALKFMDLIDSILKDYKIRE